MEQRQFSLDEVNSILPQLREELHELSEMQHAARELYEEMRDMREVGYRSDGSLIMMADYQTTKRQFDEIVAKANQILNTINQRGCRVTDVEAGLVDFPSSVEGLDVYLCWKKDEPVVAFYHGLDEGFAGRRPLPQN